MLSDDGQIMVYLDDQGSKTDATDVRVAWAKKQPSGAHYAEGGIIEQDESSYGDYNLDIAGSDKNVVVTWVRTMETPKTEPGAELSEMDQAVRMNSAEVMAAVYNGTTWTTTRLTTNTLPDLSPKAGADGDGNLTVTWRTGDGRIVCKTYQKGADGQNDGWSETEQEIYNGTLGTIHGMDATMLGDGEGTLGVVYSVDTSGGKPESIEYNEKTYTYQAVNYDALEVYATILTKTDGGYTASNIRLSDNQAADENPQLTAVNFDGKPHFVAGWSASGDTEEMTGANIALAAFDGEGRLRTDFVSTLSAVTQNGDATLSANFRFLRGATDIEDLALLWVQPHEETADGLAVTKSVVKAAQFYQAKSQNYLATGALDVTEMPDYTAIDTFDAHIGNEQGIQLAMLGTSYDATTNGTETLKITADGEELETVTVAKEKAFLYTDQKSFVNQIQVQDVSYDSAQVAPGMALPMLFQVTNRGYEDITGLTIQVGDTTQQYTVSALEPGQTQLFSLSHKLAAAVTDETYTVTATFDKRADDRPNDTANATGNLPFNQPGVGISQMETVKEANGQRTVQITLYNDTKIPLNGNPGKTVKLGIYSDSSCSEEAQVITPITLTDQDLDLVDNGAYTTQLSIDLGDFLTKDRELPESGVTFYARAWVESAGSGTNARTSNAESTAAPTSNEEETANNMAYVTYQPLYLQNGEDVTIDSALEIQGGSSVVTVSLRNNHISQTTNGNLIVTLLDKNGRVLAEQESYEEGADNNGLITLNGEKQDEVSFTFDGMVGHSVRVSYSTEIPNPDKSNVNMTLAVNGVPLEYDEETNTYSGSSQQLSSALLTIAKENRSATVTVDGQPYTQSMALPLYRGENRFTIVVTGADNKTQATYTLLLHSDLPSGGTSYQILPPAETEHGTVTVSPSRAKQGSTVTITVTPDEGYRLETLTATDKNGKEIPLTDKGDGKFTFRMPASKVTISASFVEQTEVPEGSFDDVFPEDYYYDAVQWAAENGIANGTSPTSFSPKAHCTRAQMVTFLWRAAGSPEAETEENPFTDVQAEAYYYEAVLWAAEQGIALGTDVDKFSPEATVTRAQTVTFLHRAAGSPEAEGENPFVDVPADAYYLAAVQWAAENGIALGTGPDTFSPNDNCTRGQIVTFLYRAPH